MIEIPYGPVISVTSVLNSEGDAIDYTVTGNLWKYLVSPCYNRMVITYEAGYNDIPKGIIADIRELVHAMYINQEAPGSIDIDAVCFQMVSKYSRNHAIA
jgi:hypothetical protein